MPGTTQESWTVPAPEPPYWWGEPWPSYICYGEDGRLREEAHAAFPTPDRTCLFCGEGFKPDDSGEIMPCLLPARQPMEYVHKECVLRRVVGCLAHLEGRCSCAGGHDHDDPAMTARQEAVAVWEWARAHGTER
jgi:hypothetical protein